MIPQKFIFITIVFSAFGLYFYIRDILRGTTKPNFVTWFFWMLAPFIGVYFQYKAGAGFSMLPVFLAGFVPLVVLVVASFKKNAYWHLGAFDIWCGALSLLAIIFWVVTKNPALALVFAILADAVASIPTLTKSWTHPETETALGYVPGILNNIVGLLVIQNWNFSTASFGIYFIILNITLVLFIYRRRISQTKSNTMIP